MRMPSLRQVGVLLGGMRCSFSVAVAQPQALTFDPDNSSTVEELHEYARRLWVGLDTGDVPSAMAGFRFSAIPTMWPEAALSDGIELFRNLLADRLAFTFGDDCYDLVDLLEDDPAIRARFREYTTTGKFSAPIDGTEHSLEPHLAALADALGSQDSYTLQGSVYVEAGELVSEGLQAQPPSVTNVQVGPSPAPQPYRDFLKCLLGQSLVACMADKGLYFPPDGTQLPEDRARFDCKSFALVIAAWLKQRGVPATSIKEMSFEWTCIHTNPDGTTTRVTIAHALIMVTSGDKVYVIDPQSGDIIPEFDRVSADPRQIKKAIYDWLVAHGYQGRQADDEIAIPNPKSYPVDTPWWPGTEPPWYADCALPDDHPRKGKKDQDMCFRFKKLLQECCDEQGAGRTDCGGGTTGHPPVPAQSPCADSTRYLWN
ncbi:MAG: hypothetical protein IT433_07625 [Phycisphaerales bacterium]|nr:hypothetical protein [Phycisphaerales bacterium]